MDREARNSIQRATQAARELLEQEYATQLDGVFDIRLDGTVAAEPGAHLNAMQQALRTKLVTAVDHQRAGGMAESDAVAVFLREAAFTTLNRFVALKMLEARDLVQECISRGGQSAGFKEFSGLAQGLVQLPDHGYRIYIETVFDEIGREVRVLFDRRDAVSLMWPRRQALLDLLGVLNAAELSTVWIEDETAGMGLPVLQRRGRAPHHARGQPTPPQQPRTRSPQSVLHAALRRAVPSRQYPRPHMVRDDAGRRRPCAILPIWSARNTRSSWPSEIVSRGNLEVLASPLSTLPQFPSAQKKIRAI